MPSSASQLYYALYYVVKYRTRHSPHAVTAMVKFVLIADDNAFARQRLGARFGRNRILKFAQ